MNLRIKKIIPYLLTLIVLVGVFGLIPTKQAHAQAQAMGTCQVVTLLGNIDSSTQTIHDDCNYSVMTVLQTAAQDHPNWVPNAAGATGALAQYLAANSCGIGPTQTLVPGCILAISQIYFVALPGLLLTIAAYFFNFIASITLYSDMYSGSTFLPTAWAVVRDLSNIFFILILLYIAIRIILGLGGHDTKQMIGKVIIIALLINFSMFFTEVVIDSSNILALIFYNKLSVNHVDTSGNPSPTPYQSIGGEKDIAGGMADSFNPMTLLNENFFKYAGTVTVPGKLPTSAPPSPYTVIGIMILAGSLMGIAVYAFLISGFSLISRMLELFILIIFSPFAFMSFSVPMLEHIDYIGWDKWLSRLLKVAFMAPIFMFFMYFIFLLVHANMFGSLLSQSANPSIWVTILGVLVPELVVIILLLKATKFALDGSGKLGEIAVGAAKAVGGLALGAVTGGAATIGTGLIGSAAANLAKNDNLKEKANEKGFGGYAAKLALKAGNYGSKASFDLRKAPGMGSLAKSVGLNLNAGSGIGLGPKEGGFKGAVERKEKQLKEESELMKTTKTDAQVKEWSQIQGDKYDAKMNEARNREGKNFNEDKFKKENGERPEEYSTAEALNTARMKAFQSSLGQHGLLGTLAYEAINRDRETGQKKDNAFVDDREKIKDKDGKEIDNPNYYKNSKEYKKSQARKEAARKESNDKQGEFFNEEKFSTAYDRENKPLTADAINKMRVQQAKMLIGGTAAVLTGGLTAGLGGAAIGGGLAGSYAVTERAAEAKFSAGLDKEFKKVGDIESRIKEQETILKTQNEVLGSGAELGVLKAKDANGNDLTTEKDASGNIVHKDASGNVTEPVKDAEGKVVYKVDNTKLTDELAKATVVEQDMKSQLEAINRRMASEGGRNSALDRDMEAKKAELMKKMFDSTIKTGKLTALKGIEEKMTSTRDKIYSFKGQKADMKEKSHGSGGATPKAESHAPAAAAAPKAAAPAADH